MKNACVPMSGSERDQCEKANKLTQKEATGKEKEEKERRNKRDKTNAKIKEGKS